MQNTFRALCARASRASLAAILVALAGFSAPVSVAHADAAPSSSDTVLVPRTTKGAYGTAMRVKRTSPEARRFFATQAPRLALPSTQNDSGGVGQKMACRPVALHNNKGAYSVAGGQKLARCGQTQIAKATYCAAPMPCAGGAPCPMAMTCAV